MGDQIATDCFQAQFDEIEVMHSIYGEAWRVEEETGPSNSFAIDIAENSAVVTLHLNLPHTYPLYAPPIYSLFAPTLSTLQKNQLGAKLDDVYLENIGQSVLYQWVETVREFITMLSDEPDTADTQFQNIKNDNSIAKCLNDDFAGRHAELSNIDRKVQNIPMDSADNDQIEIIHGEVIRDRKSVFQGHLARINSAQQVKCVLTKLLENKKIQNATHNMYAYRISLPNSVLVQDCEDDGEAQAGSRMLHLLQIMDVTNVLVIVSRWYGGIHLGPDRFRHINNVTRQIVEKAGLLKQTGAKSQ